MESVLGKGEDTTNMEQEVSNFKSIRAKFQEEILTKNRPMVLEKPKRLPTSMLGRSGIITINSSSAVENKTTSLDQVIFREDQKFSSGKRPVSFQNFPHAALVSQSGDCGNRHSLKLQHLPLVLPFRSEPKNDSAAPSKGIASPIKYIKKPMPAPFKPIKISLCGKDLGKNVLDNMKSSATPNVQSEVYTVKATNEEAAEIHQTRVSDPGLLCPSPEHPAASSESMMDLCSGSVTQFFDQHVLSTLEKAKRKLSHKNLFLCGRPKTYSSNKGAVSTESPPSPAESESCHPETTYFSQTQIFSNGAYGSTSLFKVNGTSHSAITDIKLNGIMQPERDLSLKCKPLPDLASMGPLPVKPPRPPRVNLSKYKTQIHGIDSTCTTDHSLESDILANTNASFDNITMPPPEFPDFDTFPPETTDTNAINIAALELEATEFLVSDSLPPRCLPEEINGSHFQPVLVQQRPSRVGPRNMWSGNVPRGSLVKPKCTETLSCLQSVAPPEQVAADLGVNGSHTAFSLRSEHQLLLEPNSQQEHFHEPCDNVYEDVETNPKFPFSQNFRKRKGAPKNPYADNGHVVLVKMAQDKDIYKWSPEHQNKEEVCRSLWHISNCAEDLNIQTQHDRKEQNSPDHHNEREQKKKEKQRLERDKKEQKEEKKRNEMHKKFKITGMEEPMYHARVLVASKPHKHDLPVRGGDIISIIRTVNCPKGKWLARDANNKYGYISVMNVELNIKEMLELGKRASQAAGRGQIDEDNISSSSRSSHQNLVLTSSFTDDSEEWTCDEETLSPSADHLSQNRAVSMPNMFYSNLSTHHSLSDGSMEDIHTQHEALQKLAVFFQNSNENLVATTGNEPSLPNTDNPGFLSAVDEPPYIEAEVFQFGDNDLLPPPELYADSL